MSSPKLGDIIMSSFAGAITASHRLFRGVLPRTLNRASEMSTLVMANPPLFYMPCVLSLLSSKQNQKYGLTQSGEIRNVSSRSRDKGWQEQKEASLQG